MENEENQIVETPRDKRLKRLKEKYPERPFETDDEIYGAWDESEAEFEAERQKRSDMDSKVSESFTQNPRFAAFFMDVMNGDSAAVAFVRHYGREALDMTDDEEALAKITEAENDYKGRVDKDKAIAEEQEANLANSQTALDKFQQENGLEDADMDSLVNGMLDKACKWWMGIFDEESLQQELMASRHDKDVEEASMAGEIRGKNAKINANRKKQTLPEGLPPALGGGGGAQESPQPSPTVSSLDNITRGKRDIWAGMKRKGN